jgi:hypothetical protein
MRSSNTIVANWTRVESRRTICCCRARSLEHSGLGQGLAAEGHEMRAAALAIACLTASAMCLPALAATGLSPSEIQAQFGNGTPFHGVTVPGGRRYSLTLNTDGTAQMTLLNDKSSQTGTWRASKSGYCSKWGRQARALLHGRAQRQGI